MGSFGGGKPITTPLGTFTDNISPYPIIGATFVGPLHDAPFGIHEHNFSRLEMTPFYIVQMHTANLYHNTDKGMGDQAQGEGGPRDDERGSGEIYMSGMGSMNDERVSRREYMNTMRIGGATEPFSWSGTSTQGSGKSNIVTEAWKGLAEGQSSALLKGVPSPDPGLL